MSLYEHKFSPSEAEQLMGYSPDFMREARRRRFGEFFGRRQANGHFAYTVQDLVGLAVAKRLVDLGTKQEFAFMVAFSAAPYVIDHIQDPRGVAQYNCVVALLEEPEPESTFQPVASIGELEALFANCDRHVCLFPIRPLAAAVSQRLRAIVIDEGRQ